MKSSLIFFTGLGLGTVLGLLVAPEPGRVTLRKVKAEADRIVDKVVQKKAIAARRKRNGRRRSDSEVRTIKSKFESMVMNFFYKAAGAVLAPFRYAQREIEDAKENFKEGAKEIASNVLKIIALVLCALFFLLFGSITVATALNSSWDSSWLGFAIVAGFYLVLAIGVYLWKLATKKKKREEEYKHDNTTITT